jgi:hypothetical protein
MPQNMRKTTIVLMAATGMFFLTLGSAGSENLTNPLPGLTPAQIADFNAGLEEFQEEETIADGLGPVFNARSG